MRRFFLFLCGLILISVVRASIPDRPLGYVSDFAGILSSSDVSALSTYLSDYEKATTNQVVVAIVPSLEGLPPEDYSIKLAEKWKIGKKGKDNGILVFIAVAEHKIRIEVGYGLEPKLTDADCGAISRDIMAPYFRNNQFAAGIAAGLQAITSKIEGKSFGSISISQTASSRQQDQGEGSGGDFFIPIFIFLVVVFLLLRLGGPGFFIISGGGGFGGFGGGGFSGGGFSGGGGSFGGGGGGGSW